MKTKVNIGDRYLGFVEILDGLNNGDKIVGKWGSNDERYKR